MAKKKQSYFLIWPLLFAHAFLVYLRGYFLSIEFTLYPYLTAHGFLPYKNILDQHFPTLIFGPFSLPALLTLNPWPLLILFLVTLCLTDVFLFAALVRFQVKKPLVWLAFYIISSLYFAGNVLWIETFVNLFLATWLWLSFSRHSFSRALSGLLLSQILLLRPTIAPALFFFFLGLGAPFSFPLVGGFLTGLVAPFIYLNQHHLLPDFYRLAIVFNGQVYPMAARLLPAKRQILFLLLWLAPVVFALWQKRKFFWLLSLASFLILIYPRFGFEHLQPLFLGAAFIWATLSLAPPKGLYFLMGVLFGLNLISTWRHPYGNYFLTPEVQSLAGKIQNLAGPEIYLLGASDLLYPLSGKLPPQMTYLPSLPWYFSQKEFSDRIITALSDHKSPVLVDYSATVDGYNIVESSGPIFEYIKINFVPGLKFGNYQFFLPHQ